MKDDKNDFHDFSLDHVWVWFIKFFKLIKFLSLKSNNLCQFFT